MRLTIQHFTPSVFWLFLILFFSALPGKEIPESGLEGFDKLIHATLYAILCFLLCIAFYKQLIFSYKRFKVSQYAALIAFSYGFLMELMQHFFCTNRSFEFMDLVANSVGCLVGVLLFKFIFNKK